MNNSWEIKQIEKIIVEPNALWNIAPYLQEKSFHNPLLVADEHTLLAAGCNLEQSLQRAGLPVALCLLKPNHIGDVVADEQSLIQLMLEVETGVTDVLLAVGSGTIHDIVRFVSLKTGIPFVSVPTAPSVDGFTSMGAPLILRGMKKTVAAVAPIAIFADLKVLTEAPQPLIAAGFGDMLGKFTSLFDWKVSHLTAGEPYDEEVAKMTEHALKSCVEHATEIARRSEEGIRILMNALIESGLAMLRFGQSHPASGAEHHLSHYWEMEYLRLGRRALLHGAKVGVASVEISVCYHAALDEGYFPGSKPEVLRQHEAQIRSWLSEVPKPDQLRQLLATVQGPSTLGELGIDSELFARSLREAHQVRLNRHTLLRALNEAK